MSTLFAHQPKPAEIEEDEEEIEEEDDEEDNESLIIVDESQQHGDEQDKVPENHARSSNAHQRCRQCDYEAEDLSDLLAHRKDHASMKFNSQAPAAEKLPVESSDIENDDEPSEVTDRLDYQRASPYLFPRTKSPAAFNQRRPSSTTVSSNWRHSRSMSLGSLLELLWLENNPLIKPLTTSKDSLVYRCCFMPSRRLLVQRKTRTILYQCSKCSYSIPNNREDFLAHLDDHHPELLEV